MNMNSQPALPSSNMTDEDDSINIREYLDIFWDGRWLIVLVAALTLLCGVCYSLFSNPVFESNLMVQVEDSEKSAGSFLGDSAASLFDVKTPAAGELEILRSRMILGQAVENTKLYISAAPRYIPVIGSWLARRSSDLSEPGFLGLPGYVSGTEKIVVPKFDVPSSLEGAAFTVVAKGNGKYTLSLVDSPLNFEGSVGQELSANYPSGVVRLLISELNGKAGAAFDIASNSKLMTLTSLQNNLKVAERGKQSGVLDISWQSTDPIRLVNLLNEIGALYVRQNVERKAAEAEKTLGFLNGELPKFKAQLEQSEDVYNKFRNQNGTISLDEEARNALAQTLDLQSKLVEAQQKRRELLGRFTEAHPSVQTLDTQILAWNQQIAEVDSRIRKMPMLQQSTLRMQRDIKVNTDLYVSLLNSSLQMRLAKEGKVGNVRLLDVALIPEEPLKPQKKLIVLLSVVGGIILGAALAVLRTSLFGGVNNPTEIEAHTGLNVYSTIPLSAVQRELDRRISKKVPGIHLLIAQKPDDPAIESLRSLRTSLQFAMLEAGNNRILISGATPGVGKSFVSVNLAAAVAASGRKVLLIDADLRKGHINQMFSQPRILGLSELIAGSKKASEVLRKEVFPNLDFISTGVLPPNPAELLMSDSFIQVLDEISPGYDFVVIDTAPVLVAADTSAVAPLAGTVLLVARAGKTHLGELSETAKRLAHVGKSVNGVILNAMDMTRRHYGSYGYRYGGYRYTQYKYDTRSD